MSPVTYIYTSELATWLFPMVVGILGALHNLFLPFANTERGYGCLAVFSPFFVHSVSSCVLFPPTGGILLLDGGPGDLLLSPRTPLTRRLSCVYWNPPSYLYQ